MNNDKIDVPYMNTTDSTKVDDGSRGRDRTVAISIVLELLYSEVLYLNDIGSNDSGFVSKLEIISDAMFLKNKLSAAFLSQYEKFEKNQNRFNVSDDNKIPQDDFLALCAQTRRAHRAIVFDTELSLFIEAVNSMSIVPVRDKNTANGFIDCVNRLEVLSYLDDRIMEADNSMTLSSHIFVGKIDF